MYYNVNVSNNFKLRKFNKRKNYSIVFIFDFWGYNANMR